MITSSMAMVRHTSRPDAREVVKGSCGLAGFMSGFKYRNEFNRTANWRGR
jgi:hypothetical protein